MIQPATRVWLEPVLATYRDGLLTDAAEVAIAKEIIRVWCDLTPDEFDDVAKELEPAMRRGD